MDLNNFFTIIKKSKVIPKSKSNIAYEVFIESEIEVSKDTIDKKLKNERTPYCKDVKIINENGFLNYFKRYTKFTWKTLQSAFKNSGADEFVDCNTDESYVFYCSLLKLFYALIQCVPITLKSKLPEVPLIFGRESELYKIEQNLKNSNYAFISGMNGIGKTTLALSFAYKLKEKGWKIQFVDCNTKDTFMDIINNIEFDGLKNAKNPLINFTERINVLKKIIGPILIIVDNYNYTDNQIFIECKKNITKERNDVKFLFTGESCPPKEQIPSISLDRLDEKALLELYAYFRFDDGKDHSKYIEENAHSIIRLCDLFNYHTLAVTLLAKKALITLSTEDELYDFCYPTLCQQTGYGIYPRESDIVNIKNAFHIIFDFSILDDDEKLIMTYMSMMPPSGVNIKLFCALTGCKREKINKLKKLNMIIVNEESLIIKLHNLICDTILETDELRPTKEMGMEILEKKKILEEAANRETDCIKNEYNIDDYLEKLNQIAGSIIHKAIFPSCTTVDGFNFLNLLKDKYKNSLLLLNQAAAYTSHKDCLMDEDVVFDGYVASLKLNTEDDDDDEDEDDNFNTNKFI